MTTRAVSSQSWLLSAVRALVAVDRPARGQAPCLSAEFSDDEWREIVGQIRRHRLTMLFAAHAGALQLPDTVRATLAAARRRQMGEGLIATAHTSTLSSALQAGGVDHLVVKGAALSALVHDEPAARGVGDIDVWVRPEGVERAEAVIAELGWRPRPATGRRAEPGDGWRWGLYRFGLHERPWDGDGRPTVDVHWRLAHRQDNLGFDFDEAHGRSVPVTAIGPTVRTLCAADALAHMTEHARKEAFPTLRSLFDIVQLVDLCGPDVVVGMAQGRSPSARNVQLGLAVAAEIAPDLAMIHPPSARQRRLARRAVEGCMSLRMGGNVRVGLGGSERKRISLHHHTWVVVSAPSPASAASYLARLATVVVGLGTTAWRRQ